MLAIDTLGALAVPVNFRMTAPEVAFLADNSGATLLVTDEPLSRLAEAVAAQSDSVTRTITVGEEYERLLVDANHAAPVDVPDDAPVGAFDPAALLDVLESEEVTTLFLVPVQWQAICAEQSRAPRAVKLRVISWGAAPASDTILKAMSATFPDALNVAVFGQTEMSPITCVLDGADALRKLGSVGRVIATVSARVVDDDMKDVARGEIGEIVYQGPTLMREYWRNPDATADAFGGGWFHSGDLVRQDEEGFVFVVDRKKDMIISGGENIYCAEVENVLFSHPRIREAAVIGRTDGIWGEVPVAVVALTDTAGGPNLTLEELVEWLGEHLARYKYPKELVVVDALPRNASGKVVKVALRSTYSTADAI